MRTTFLFAAALSAGFAVSCQSLPAQQDGLNVSVDRALLDAPYTGRVYVMLSENAEREPRLQGRWFNPPMTFVTDVRDWNGRRPVNLGDAPLANPTPLADVPAGDYTAQAFIRISPDSANAGQGPGDLYSVPTTVTVTQAGDVDLDLVLTETVAPEERPEAPQVRYIPFRSDALSNFHGRDVTVDLGVRLPKDWSEDTDETWPVLISVTGFGGDETSIRRFGAEHLAPALDEMIVVVPDATNYWGHSVFADSANTGPWGQALIEEIIPYIDAELHGAGAEKRYVTGISSGGWSSLWLQVTYPDAFASVWSFVPDPVDFRDFQQINLYAEGENMYRDAAGDPRPLARRNGEVMITYEPFVKAEDIYGPGGQIGSFEAVFSPRGDDGLPVRIFDRETGDIDTGAAKAWEPYDINLVLQRNWDELGPKLAGKLHIYAGGEDTFYLEGATELLKETLADLGSDAVVEIVPGLPHAPAPGVTEAMLSEISGVAVEPPASD